MSILFNQILKSQGFHQPTGADGKHVMSGATWTRETLTASGLAQLDIRPATEEEAREWDASHDREAEGDYHYWTLRRGAEVLMSQTSDEDGLLSAISGFLKS